jgi:sarcosine oxidase
MRTEFAVVGSGLVGLSAAWSLVKRGHQVTALDQAPVGHTDGGSHGSCRIFRLGYENPAYVPLAKRARDVWSELEEASGQRLLVPTPQLTFGPLVGQVQAAMLAAGAACESLTQEAAAERFPGLTVTGEVLYEPESAVIRADAALSALSGLLTAAGQPPGWPGTGQPAKVTSIARHGDSVRVSTQDGELDADAVIVCAGPWTSKLVAGAGLAVPSAASMEQVGYLAPAATRSAQAAGEVTPIFIDYGVGASAGGSPYGLPVPGTDRYKIGIHFSGPAVDPDRQDHTENAGLRSRIEQAARQLLPGYAPDPVGFERCIYDNSPDTDFIIDRLGDIVIGCGTSGHGFKFGPLIGDWLAELALNASAPDTATGPPSWLGLSRF